MKRLHLSTPAPDRLKIRPNPLVPSLFGALLTALGVVAIASGILAYAAGPGPQRFYAPMSLTIGVLLAFGGLYLLTTRSGCEIDRVANRIRTWSSVFGRRRTTRTEAVSSFDRVMLVRFWFFNRAARAERNYRFRVDVGHAEDDSMSVRIGTNLTESEARAHAATIAAFIGLPIEESKGMARGVVAG